MFCKLIDPSLKSITALGLILTIGLSPASASVEGNLAITDSDRAILSEASGGQNASEIFTRRNVSCDFFEQTQYRRANSSFEKDVCLQTAPANGALDLSTATLKITYDSNCSRQGPLRAGKGSNTQILSEIDRIYGRAIELAVGKGDLQAKARIEAMRDYAKSLVSVNAPTDTVYAHIRANGGGWPFGYRGFCGGSLSVDYIQLLPG